MQKLNEYYTDNLNKYKNMKTVVFYNGEIKFSGQYNNISKASDIFKDTSCYVDEKRTGYKDGAFRIECINVTL